MIEVESCCVRYSLRTGSIFIFSLYLILEIILLVAEMFALDEDNHSFEQLLALGLTLIAMLCSIFGLGGIYATLVLQKTSLLVPVLIVKMIYLVAAAILFIYFIFSKKFPLSNTFENFGRQNFGVVLILYPAALALCSHFWIVIHSYYMKLLKEGTPAR